MAKSWADDLTIFSMSAVTAACDEWRQYHRKRPTPAELRELCEVHQRIYDNRNVQRLEAKTVPKDAEISPEERSLVAAKFQAWREMPAASIEQITERALEILGEAK